MKELILLSVSAIIFISYLTYILVNHCVQKSISMSYYKLPKKYKLVFLGFVWGFALPLGILINGQYNILLLAVVLIMIVGITPNIVEYEAVNTVHLFGAFGGILTAMSSLWLEFDLPFVVLAAFFVAGVIFKSVKNYIWWIEVLAFSVIWTVFFYVFKIK